jgi:hypothetical protein
MADGFVVFFLCISVLNIEYWKPITIQRYLWLISVLRFFIKDIYISSITSVLVTLINFHPLLIWYSWILYNFKTRSTSVLHNYKMSQNNSCILWNVTFKWIKYRTRTSFVLLKRWLLVSDLTSIHSI